MSAPRILLFRSAKLEDAFVDRFENAGWQVCIVPVLDFQFVAREQLMAVLSSPNAYAGLIVTSPRAGDFLGNVFAKSDDLRSRWAGKPFVCIGPRTARRIKALELNTVISETARGIAVAELVGALSSEFPWLFVCGNLRRNELPNALSASRVAFEELQVYQTLIKPDVDLCSEEKPDWVTFFSPSGFEAVRETWPDNWQHVQIAAIGETTANAIRSAGWQVSAIAERPTPVALHAAIRACKA